MTIIESVINEYPTHVKQYANQIYDIIYNVARKNNLGNVEESLKWGEPSFKVKGGSPIRFDWKANTPNNFYIFFICNTTLVETFRTLYSPVLEFQDNRAIVLDISKELPIDIIEDCINIAFNYHKK